MIGLLTPALSLLKDSNVAKVIAIIIGIILLLLILLPVFRKLKRKRIKSKETAEIMQDLKVWRHLSQLVQGGEGHEQAKQLLSDNIIKINELIKEGFANLADYARGLYSSPWYILLGEPRSGKSLLMKESELELVPSTEEKDDPEDHEGKNSLPVRFWYGAKAVVCDISGRVFFDRWLEGSSAEWSYIVRQLCRKRKRKPFSGIVLTIPADALLADTDSLSHKKAVLIANELSYLLKTSGMCLPCYVVVTKLDMVNGFREFVSNIKGDLRHQFVGFENSTQSYDEAAFKSFWGNLVDRVRLGSRQMLTRELNVDINAEETLRMERMDVNGKLYVFPENLKVIYNNLSVYLSALFGKNNFHGTKNTFFEGVAFTSSTDMGISFSPALASLVGLHTDELIIPGTKPVRSSGYFSHDALHNWVFRPSPHLSFTGKTRIFSRLPQYAAIAALTTLGLIWLLSALFNKSKMTVDMTPQIAYYSSLDALLFKGSPFESPLIKKDEITNVYRLDDEPIAGELVSSRVQFYFNAVTYRDMNIKVPFGWYLSNAFVFGPGQSIGYKTKVYITNQLYGSMIRTPVIKNFGRKLIEEENQPIVLDHTLRNAIGSFVVLDEMRNTDLHEIFRSKAFDMKPMIESLLGDVSNNTMSLLTSYNPRYDRDYSFTLDANYIYSDDFLSAKEAGLNTIISAWGRFSVYPDSFYGKIKQLVRISDELVSNFEQINAVLGRVNSINSIESLRSIVDDWTKLTNRHKYLVNSGHTLFNDITEKLSALHIPMTFNAQNGNLDPFGDNLITTFLFNDIVINTAVNEYKGLFDSDMNYVENKIGVDRTTRSGQIRALRRDFERNILMEITKLKSDAAALRSNELYVKKMEDKIGAPSYFIVSDQVLNLASNVEIPTPESIKKSGHAMDWQYNRYDITGVIEQYDDYVKPYIENKNTAVLMANARNMLIAEAFLNRYVVFDTFFPFLKQSDEIIAANIEGLAKNDMIFSFSDNAIQNVIGTLRFNKSYDPVLVKTIIDNIVEFLNLFKSSGDNAPRFLYSLDRSLYEKDSLQGYLGNYVQYWQNYADNAYNPAGSWSDYQYCVSMLKPYQVNTVLQDMYSKSIEFINNLDDATLSQSAIALKSGAISFLNDRIKLLSTYMSADAERMLSAWDILPRDVETAFKTLQNTTKQDLKDKYMTIYSGKKDIKIGWWDSFILDGLTILSHDFSEIKLIQFESLKKKMKSFPICSDAPLSNALSLNDVNDIALLLNDMGAGLLPEQPLGENDDAFIQKTLHPILFTGRPARQWAQTVYGFAGAVSNIQSPFVWSLIQPPVAEQTTLPANGQLLAINRFRYMRVSSANRGEQSFNTYSSQPLTLTQGKAQDSGLTVKLFKTSGDRYTASEFSIEGPWMIFQLYLRDGGINGDKGQRYIPLHFLDTMEGSSFVYFTEISFNNPVPAAEAWYNTLNWPNLQSDQNLVNADNAVQSQFSESVTGEKNAGLAEDPANQAPVSGDQAGQSTGAAPTTPPTGNQAGQNTQNNPDQATGPSGSNQ
ncbi:MAG: hypothetical protein LBV68_04680 [Spirochaetaceae bacterium]|jgi:hypothetical protein|nr:hypothetical protein [Spirochaetaceae bacterium]